MENGHWNKTVDRKWGNSCLFVIGSGKPCEEVNFQKLLGHEAAFPPPRPTCLSLATHSGR